MAVDVKSRGNVGCAYYVAREEKLYFMEDVKHGGADVVEARKYRGEVCQRGFNAVPVKLFIDPTTMVVPMRLDEAILEKLDPEARGRGTSDDRSINASSDLRERLTMTGEAYNLPYSIDLRPSGEFAYEAATHKLANLRIGEAGGPRFTFIVPGDVVAEDGMEGGSIADQGNSLRLAGFVDLESVLTVGCAGAILSCIQRKRAAAFLPGDQNAQAMYRISTVEMFSLSGSM